MNVGELDLEQQFGPFWAAASITTFLLLKRSYFNKIWSINFIFWHEYLVSLAGHDFTPIQECFIIEWVFVITSRALVWRIAIDNETDKIWVSLVVGRGNYCVGQFGRDLFDPFNCGFNVRDWRTLEPVAAKEGSAIWVVMADKNRAMSLVIGYVLEYCNYAQTSECVAVPNYYEPLLATFELHLGFYRKWLFGRASQCGGKRRAFRRMAQYSWILYLVD